MRIKQFFTNLVMALVLSVMVLPNTVFATGEEEPHLPNQGQEDEIPEKSEEADNYEDSSSDCTSIGGGLNADSETQPVPNQPAQPESPSISKPLLQPEEPDTEIQHPAPATSTTPTATVSKPTLSPIILKPQSQSPKPNVTTVPVALTAETVDTEESQTVSVDIPTAPNDSIAPTIVEIPHTSSTETQAPVNPFVVILLILVGITILAAGIVSTWLSKAAQRYQRTI